MCFMIVDRIVYLRKRDNLSQKELSEAIFQSRSHVSNLEKNRSPLTVQNILKLCNFFEVPQNYFSPCDYRPKFRDELEASFEKLLYNDTECLHSFFSKDGYDLEVGQEVAYRLLQAVYYLKKNDFELATNLINNFIPTFIKNAEQIADNLTLQKYYHFYLYEKNFKENSLNECLEHSKILSELATDQKQKGRFMVFQSQILYRKGLLHENYTCINKTIDFIKSFDSGLLLASAYVNLSSVLLDFKLYDEALENLEKIKLINIQHNNKDLHAVYLHHRGLVLKNTKQYIEAIENLEAAYNCAKHPHNQTKMLISIIICNIKLKQLPKAKEYHNLLKKQNLRLHEKMISQSLECEITLYENDLNFHEQKLQKVLKYFEANGYTSDLKYIYSYLLKYYFDKKMYKKVAIYSMLKERLEND